MQDDSLDLATKLRKLELLQRKKAILEENPVLSYQPNPGQWKILAAFNDPAVNTIIWQTGNRSGKTDIAGKISTSCCRGYYPFLQPTHPLYRTPINPNTKHPDGTTGVRINIASTPKELEQTIQHMINQTLMPGEVLNKHKNNATGVYTRWELTNGSIISCYSYKQDPEEYEGSKCDLWFFNEPPPRKIYVAAKRGLIDRRGKAIIAGTLITQPWITRELVAKAKKGDKRFYHLETTSEINIGYGITAEGLKDYADELTDIEYRVRILGQSVALSGVVVQEYDPQVHNIQEPRDYAPEWFPGNEWPADWGCYAALDPHPAKKWHFMLAGVDPSGVLHLFKEIYWRPQTDEQAVKDIKDATEGYYVLNWLIDPLARSPSMHLVDYTLMEFFRMHELPFENGTKSRENGIFNIKRRFMVNAKTGPRIKIWPMMLRTKMELESWLWADPEEMDVEEMMFKAQPKYDDAMSNLYRILALDPVHTPLHDAMEPLPDWETF